LVSPTSLAADTVRDFLNVADGPRVLDLGCEYGDIAKCFVSQPEYAGINSDQGSIDEANLRFRDTNTQFIVADIADPEVLALGQFDLVLPIGVLNHDQQSTDFVHTRREMTIRIQLQTTFTSRKCHCWALN
jgi:cyclopropane fatty-acyl-phospholipid synthase-like methyltransferase